MLLAQSTRSSTPLLRRLIGFEKFSLNFHFFFKVGNEYRCNAEKVGRFISIGNCLLFSFESRLSHQHNSNFSNFADIAS